jgi:DNA-binding response OmpR family regulator
LGQSPQGSGAAQKGAFVMKKILAIDDQAEVINIITDFLEDSYDVYPAKNTTKAFALLRANDFDLMLLDILMPGMNGIEFLEYVKQQIWYKKTPVIVVSSESDFRTVTLAINLGAADYIKKPIDKDVLLKKIKAVIGE